MPRIITIKKEKYTAELVTKLMNEARLKGKKDAMRRIFKVLSNADYLLDRLIKNKIIDPISLMWIKRGSDKGRVSAMFNYLKKSDYLEDNVTYEDLSAISKKVFNIAASKNSIKTSPGNPAFIKILGL